MEFVGFEYLSLPPIHILVPYKQLQLMQNFEDVWNSFWVSDAWDCCRIFSNILFISNECY